MKNLIALLVLIAVVVVCHKALPEGGPTYSTIAKNPNASAGDQVLARIGMPLISWDVDNYVVFKTATGSLGGREFVLVTTPISEGKWHMLNKEGQ